MVQHLIVPVDGSADSWRAFDVALSLAERTHSDVRIVEVAGDPVDRDVTRARLHEELEHRGPFHVEVTVDARLAVGPIANELAQVIDELPGSVFVMSSHGKGRSAAFVGSVTEDVIHNTFGPIVLVGPGVESIDFSGPVIVSVDGSSESEAALPLAAAWSIDLGATPWIIHVADPSAQLAHADGDVLDSAYPARLAGDLSGQSGHDAEFDELHDRHPSQAVPEYATRHGASMIVASSHGRSGLSRLAMGSVTAGFVRNATCPVLVVRLPQPSER